MSLGLVVTDLLRAMLDIIYNTTLEVRQLRFKVTKNLPSSIDKSFNSFDSACLD